MARRTFNSIESTADQAEAFVQQGRWIDAEKHYRDLIGQTHVIDYEYDDWLRRLGEIYRHLGRSREAGFIYLYLHYFDLAKSQLHADEDLPMRARILEIEKRHGESAALYAQARMPVHAAVSWEKAKMYPEAAGAWESLLGHPGLRDRDYEQALVAFDYGMTAVRLDPASTSARKALI